MTTITRWPETAKHDDFYVALLVTFLAVTGAFTLVTGSDAPAAPVTLVLPAIGASTSGIDFGIRMSAAFLAAVPTLILYVAFAEQFAKGLRTEA